MDEERYWWVRLALGLAAGVVGVAVIAWPGATIRVLAALFAIDIVVDGCGRLLRAILARGEGAGIRALFAGLGVLGIVVGLVFLANLPQTVAAVVLLTGLFWLVTGALEIIVALVRRGPARGLALGVGVVSLIVGALVLAFPKASLGLLVLLVGGSLIAHGAVSAALAIAHHRQAGRLRAARSPGLA